jgi:hypothetical protein
MVLRQHVDFAINAMRRLAKDLDLEGQSHSKDALN